MNIEQEIEEIKKELAGFEKGLTMLTKEIVNGFKMFSDAIVTAFTNVLKQTEQESKPLNDESRRMFL